MPERNKPRLSAHSILRPPNLQQADVLELLAHLVDKSLVVVDTPAGGESRYRFLETIRQYAREKLTMADEADQLRRQHLTYFLQLAEQAEIELIGPRQVAWLRHLDYELDNLRSALEWSLERNVQAGLRLAGALMRYWVANSPLRDVIDWLSQLLRQPSALARTAVRARALGRWAGSKSGKVHLSKPDRLPRRAWRSIASWATNQVSPSRLASWETRSVFWMTAPRETRLRPRVWRSTRRLAIGSASPKRWAGWAACCMRRTTGRGAPIWKELAIFRGLGNVAGISQALKDLGLWALRQGDYAAALGWLSKSLEEAQPVAGECGSWATPAWRTCAAAGRVRAGRRLF